MLIKKTCLIFKSFNKTIVGIIIVFINIIFYFEASNIEKDNEIKELKELVIQTNNDNIELKNSFKDFTANVSDIFTKTHKLQFDSIIIHNKLKK